MLVKTDLINRIKDYFGLNIYETKVWLALLAKGIASAGEIAEISRVPRSRTYDVLESLEKKGFAIIKLGKPIKYLGVKPDTIIEKLKNNVRSDAEEKIQILGNIKQTEEFMKLEEIYKKGLSPIKPADLSAAIRGRSNISNYLKEILQNARKEVIICTNAEDVASKKKLFQQTLENLSKRNIKTKIALFGDEKLIKKTEKDLGIKTMQIDVESKFFIVDRKEMLFYLSNGNTPEDIAIWINSEFFSQAFASFFDKAIGNQ